MKLQTVQRYSVWSAAAITAVLMSSSPDKVNQTLRVKGIIENVITTPPLSSWEMDEKVDSVFASFHSCHITVIELSFKLNITYQLVSSKALPTHQCPPISVCAAMLALVCPLQRCFGWMRKLICRRSPLGRVITLIGCSAFANQWTSSPSSSHKAMRAVLPCFLSLR